MSTGGEVANALVCKTSIRGFNSRPVLQIFWVCEGTPGPASRGHFQPSLRDLITFPIYPGLRPGYIQPSLRDFHGDENRSLGG